MRHARIFISYRRQDANPYAHRIYDHIAAALGSEELFFDADTIPPGVDFVEFLDKAVASCDILLAVIGRSWLTIADAQGHPRIHDPDDFVAVEIEAALRRGVRVIPLLVGGAQMPQKNELPEAIKALSRRQAYELPDKGFIHHLESLLSIIKQPLSQAIAGDANGFSRRKVKDDSKRVSERPHERTRSEVLREMRAQITSALSLKFQPLSPVGDSHSKHWTTDGTTRVVIAISKEYVEGNFWYSYHPYWDDFLAPARVGLIVFACVGRGEAFAIPFDWIQKRFKALNVTNVRGRMYFHIHLRPDSKGELFLSLKNGEREPVKEFAVPLRAAAKGA